MMEMLGVNKNPATMMKLRRQQKRNDDVSKIKKKKKQEREDIKVTYISSPMKVKTCASNFRALVQELTGQDSKVADKFLNHQESVSEDHDDDENDEAIAMAAGASVDNKNGDDYVYQHEVEDQGIYLPKLEDSSSWLDLLREDYCSSFQYSRSLFEPFNQQLVHQV